MVHLHLISIRQILNGSHALFVCLHPSYCQDKEDASFFLLSATLPLPLPQPSRLKKSKKKCERGLSDPSLREWGTCNCLAGRLVDLKNLLLHLIDKRKQSRCHVTWSPLCSVKIFFNRTVVELALIRRPRMYTFSIIVIEVTCNW